MASGTEIVKRPDKSSFSVTCSLLSQYIKEKGSPSDLCLGKPEAYPPLTTMSMLTGVGITDDNTKETKSMELFLQSAVFGLVKEEAKEPEKSQLTIFYGGKVLVFNNFPAEKAKDLMQLACKRHSVTSGTTSMVSSSVATPVVDVQISSATAKSPVSFPVQAQPSFSDLPIARKASLHRFLEKRKDRINAKAPYQTSNNSGSKDIVTVKEEISQPWLGLGPHMLKPGSNSNCNR